MVGNRAVSRRLVRIFLALAFATGVARPAAAQLYAGQGTWVTDDGNVSGTWQGTIDVAGQDLSGDLILTGIPDLTEATIDGTWHDGVIDYALVKYESDVATITGTITDPLVAGTFTMPVGAGVTGTWQGQITLIPDDSTPTPAATDPTAGSTPTPGPATPTPAPAPTDPPTPAAPDATPTSPT